MMRFRPSRFSAQLTQGFCTLWEDDYNNLFLPWLGVQGSVFPVDPSIGRVRTDGPLIQVPHGSDQAPPDIVLVEPVRVNPGQMVCRVDAHQQAPKWLQEAQQQLLVTRDVTLVERLVCLRDQKYGLKVQTQRPIETEGEPKGARLDLSPVDRLRNAFAEPNVPPERAIHVPSTWRRAHEGTVTVDRLVDQTVHYHWDEGDIVGVMSVHEFTHTFTWVSNESAPERPIGPLSTWMSTGHRTLTVAKVLENVVHYNWDESGKSEVTTISDFRKRYTWVADPKVVAYPSQPLQSFYSRLSRLEAHAGDLMTTDELRGLTKVVRAAQQLLDATPEGPVGIAFIPSHKAEGLRVAVREYRDTIDLLAEHRARLARVMDFS